MLLPRCPPCVGRRYSKSTIEIFCPLPGVERRSSSQQPLSCLGQSSQGMQLITWNSWQCCGRRRLLPAVPTLRFFGRLWLTNPGLTSSLPLKSLIFKLVMLLALTRPSRLANLATLQVDRRQYKPEGVVFLPAAKQSSQGRVLKEFFFPSFPHNTNLCPAATLRQYEAVTATLRPSDSSGLFVAIKKPHNPMA